MVISLCIPAYGREKMLMQAIYSVLIQEHQDWEIIIRDDCPENPVGNNSDVRRLFDFLGSRLRYFIEPHLGTYSQVANATLKQASGDILAMLASDDMLHPNTLRLVNQAFEEERFGGAFWLYGQTVSVDHNLKFTGGIDGAPITYENLLKQNSIGVPSTFWNREMMQLAGMFDTRYKWAADYDLWLRFWRYREPRFIAEPFGIFRHHTHQTSKERAVEVEDEARRISVRHSTMGTLIFRARSIQLTKQAYEGGEMPRANDDI